MSHKRGFVEAIERFDEWSSSYEQSFTWRHFFEPLHLLMLSEIGDVDGLSILDLGCGTGDMLRRFAMAGGRRMVGVDASEGMLGVATRLSRDYGNIEFITSSVEALPFTDSGFDLVTSCIALHHFPHPLQTFREINRVLNPGGRLYLCDLDEEGLAGKLMLAYGRLKKDDHYFDRESLLDLARRSGLEAQGAEKVRFFPPAILLTAIKPLRL